MFPVPSQEKLLPHFIALLQTLPLQGNSFSDTEVYNTIYFRWSPVTDRIFCLYYVLEHAFFATAVCVFSNKQAFFLLVVLNISLVHE